MYQWTFHTERTNTTYGLLYTYGSLQVLSEARSKSLKYIAEMRFLTLSAASAHGAIDTKYVNGEEKERNSKC